MKHLLIAAFAALAFAGCANTNKNTLKVGSYNIRLQQGDTGTKNAWDERKLDLVDFIGKLDLDAFGLQEVCPDQADYLTNNLPHYVMVGVHRDDGKRRGEASPVFFRKDRFDALKSGTFWLSETPDVPGSKSWNTACTRVCSWMLLKDRKSGKIFCFANTHTDHKSELARKNGMLLIIKKMREFAPAGTPVIFTGDHNCKETSEPAMAISALLRDTLYATETPPSGPWRTYNGWKHKESELEIGEALKMPKESRNDQEPRIDYIYVSDGIKVKSHASRSDTRPGTKLYPSDHFPVTAEIEL